MHPYLEMPQGPRKTDCYRIQSRLVSVSRGGTSSHTLSFSQADNSVKDGSVRQHDLRRPHDCHHGPCPTPLVKVNHELSTLALSPLTPYQFVVAGESPYVRLDSSVWDELQWRSQ